MTQEERIEKTAEEYFNNREGCFGLKDLETFYYAAKWASENQWISVEDELPQGNRILVRLSETFCGKEDVVTVLYYYEGDNLKIKHPEGYYDDGGENVPYAAMTHWMPIPPLPQNEQQ